MYNDDDKSKRTICLIDGKQYPYDARSDDRNYYNPEKFYYIGYGVVYSVNNVPQTLTWRCHFFVKKF